MVCKWVVKGKLGVFCTHGATMLFGEGPRYIITVSLGGGGDNCGVRFHQWSGETHHSRNFHYRKASFGELMNLTPKKALLQAM